MPIAPLPSATRLLLINDHQIRLDGLILTLDNLRQKIKRDQAHSVREAEQQARQCTYDLILLDLHLPDSTGLAVFEKLRAIDPLTPVAILTDSTSDGMNAAQHLGAVGFRDTTNGPLLISEQQQQNRQTKAQRLGITPRQLETLDLLAEGLPNKEICQRLSLSEDTVKTHLKAVFAALGCRNRTECVNTARKHRLINS